MDSIMKKIVNLLATLSFLLFISPISQAASCAVSDVTVDGANANECRTHEGENNDNYINDINTDFSLSSTYSWQEFKNDIPTNYSGSTSENGIGISGDLTNGVWTFSGTLTDPFVIAIKASNSFASYLFEGQQGASNGTFKMIFENKKGIPHDLSHFSIYTTVSNVPLPAALWLFAPALLGFMGFRRKTKS